VCAAKLIKDKTMKNFTFKGSSADDTILVGANGQDIC
jgi:hypothetical protein